MRTLKTVSKWIAGAALAGALFFATPQKAEAQRFSVGIGIGAPVYGGGYCNPYYGYRCYPYAVGYPVYGGYYGHAYRGYYGRPYYGAAYSRGYYGRGYVRGGYGHGRR